MNFPDRTILITGATGNLGRAVAAAFAAHGANLVLLDRHVEHLEQVFGKETGQSQHLGIDLLDQVQVQHSIADAVARFGRIDVVCNVAGAFGMGPRVHETRDDDWTALFDINVRTLVNVARSAVPHLINGGGGKVINVAATSANKGMAQMGPYIAAKSAVIRITEALSAELREDNINVNCVLPSIIDTPENRAAMPEADFSRWVTPADIANVIVFLASEEARAVHGVALPVTGLS